MLTIWQESFYLKVFGKLESTLQKSNIVALKVLARNNETLILELICAPVITSFAFQYQVRHAVKKYEHLRNLKLAHTSPHEVTNINILIGLDHLNEPIAINSVLGWRICRNYRNKNPDSSTLCNFFVQTKTSFSRLKQKITKLYSVKARRTYSTADSWKPPIHSSDWLIFCCGNLILYQKKK